MKGDGGESGFTLVELLVVLAAGSLLLVGLSWVLQGVAIDYRKARDADAQATGMEDIGHLRTLVENALPGATTDGDGSPTYLVSPPLALGGTGPLQLKLHIAREEDGQALIATFQNAEGRTLAAPPVRLLRGYDRIDLEPLDGGEIPSLRLQVRRGKTEWTYLFRPRVNTVSTCRFDPISLDCRT